MASLKSQLFQQYANEGLKTLTIECQNKYEPKKEDRFNFNGITYEIGSAQFTDEKLEFEISSKIPQDELSSKVTLQDYFQAIKDILVKVSNKPKSIDMENITRELGGNERKERDYVKLKYSYGVKKLFDEKKLIKELEELYSKGETDKIPDVPGITTPLGKMILIKVRDSVYSNAQQNMQDLIDANETVRRKLIRGKKK
jgi:hypothetical protein